MTLEQRIQHFGRRWRKFLPFWIMLSLTPLLGTLVGESSEHLQRVALRIAIQTALLYSVGSWWTPSEWLRFFRHLQVPDLIMQLFNTMMHFGLLLASETKRKLESLRLRFAGLSFVNSPSTAGAVLASSMELSFDRLLRVEESRELRSAKIISTSLDAKDGEMPSASSRSAASTQNSETINAAIEIESLNLRIDSHTVLENFSFQARHGEWIGIVGPSGCGKTTLLKCIAGLIEPTGGRLTVCGRDLNELPIKKRVTPKVQMLFQDPWDQILGITPFEDLNFNFKESTLSAKEIEQSISEMCEKVGLGQKMHRSVSTFSFGERKRLCIAQLLLTSPEIILCDEPTSGLDSKNIQHITNLLVERFGNKTVLWVTHDLHQLPDRLDRVVDLSH